MTRQEQNTLIINSITNKLKDLPNVQQIISSKFDSWFRTLVQQGQDLLMQGQTSAAGGESGGGEQAAAQGGEGAPA